MKWTTQQVTELRQLCIQGVSNKELSRHFGVPRAEIHAKRSSLGITIPKVKAGAVDPETARQAVERDSKRNLIRLFSNLVHTADSRVDGVMLSKDGKAIYITFAGGSGTCANIDGDSLMSVMHFVTAQCLF
jgi:hypothetical protein